MLKFLLAGTLSVVLLIPTGARAGQIASADEPAPGGAALAAAPTGAQDSTSYLLGPGDQLSFWVLDAEELSGKSFRVDDNGLIDLPLVGRMQAGGFTVQQFQAELVGRLKKSWIRNPQVVISVIERHSQPVTIVGAVAKPGTYQLERQKTLVEMLSTAGGLRPDAGPIAMVTRRLDQGRIPLPGASDDPSGEFSIAEVSLNNLLQAQNSQANMTLRPYDVISVPSTEKVYVIGDVVKPGEFELHARKSVSVLQVLAMAGGLTKTALPQDAKILRLAPGEPRRTEVSVDVSQVVAGTADDVALLPEDILVVPGKNKRELAGRVLETVLRTGASAALWGLIR